MLFDIGKVQKDESCFLTRNHFGFFPLIGPPLVILLNFQRVFLQNLPNLRVFQALPVLLPLGGGIFFTPFDVYI